MNYWMKLSYDFANQQNYLDELFKVYPTIPEGIRCINEDIWNEVEKNFNNEEDVELIKSLLKLELFPVKDSYVAYLRRDKKALDRNPNTVARLCGRIREMGLSQIYYKSTEPKETNRQIGPMFKRWVETGVLGYKPVPLEQFVDTDKNAILSGSDQQLKDFACQFLGYKGDKGLDFLARFNKKYIVGETKFLTDFGGHQNAQYNDAMSLLNEEINAIKIAILDGVCYIDSVNGKLSAKRNLNENIMSALVLREFLYQV